MEKKSQLTAALLSLFLLSAVAVTQFVNSARANPYHIVDEGEVSPPSDMKPPSVLIFSPTNNTEYASNNFSLTIKIENVLTIIPISLTRGLFLAEVYYEASWLSNKTTIYRGASNQTLSSLSINVTVLGIPEGDQYLKIFAIEHGLRETYRGPGYPTPELRYGSYSLIGSSVVYSIINTPPNIVILSENNKTRTTSNVPLNFVVSKPVQQITYCLDGQNNVTITGNTTLTGLPNGDHNVTVYATDEAENTGASETSHFTVAESEPFPTALVVASIVSVAIISVGLLLYFKKRKR